MAYSFQNLKAYTSRTVNSALEQYTPRIGEDYQLTMEFDVSGNPLGDYYVKLDLADKSYSKTISKSKTGHQIITHNFGALPLDDEIPWEVQIDPYDTAGGADPTSSPIKPPILTPIPVPIPTPVLTPMQGTPGTGTVGTVPPLKPLIAKTHVAGTLIPVPPAKGVEYFEPVRLQGYQQMALTFAAGGQITKMALLMSQPASDSWQKMISNSCSGNIAGIISADVDPLPATAQRFWPFFCWEVKGVPAKQTLFKQEFVVEVRNQRVNCKELRKVTWAQIDALDGINVFKFYKQPEAVIESKDAKITGFVQQTLGSNYRSTFTPYDAARKMFLAIIKRVTYTYPKEGEVDKRGHTAVQTFDKKLGDCGSFSMLIVACFRNMGIPARTACGAWIGGGGHCWSEFYLPGHGWILCDGSGGNGWSEYGHYAYCFGNQFDLNARMAFMRGNTFDAGDYEASWLQGPAGPWLWGAAVDQSAAKTVVEETPTIKRIVTDLSGKRIKRMQFECPCERQGGFRPNLEVLKKLVLAHGKVAPV